MRIALFDDHRVGIVDGAVIRDVSGVIEERWRGTPYATTVLIERWDELQVPLDVALGRAQERDLADVRLLPPLPRPRQLLAAPANYQAHVDEMRSSRHAPNNAQALQSPREVGFFVKASGSISGPADRIELPELPGRQFHHEVELGLVIGKPARAVARHETHRHVFGYVCLLDITLRIDGERQEERTLRKSFETFTPMGPFIVTADEIADAADIDLRLWVNDELRQEANTRDLIVDIPELLEQASRVVTLHPGDVYATGTPDGVGPIIPGDTVRAVVGGVGELVLPVVQRDW
jgi:2-keto-4-pentenoate hydratase/2-oxohepta-3-ene-1,7-dioic acid hydratase in catechol pathway